MRRLVTTLLLAGFLCSVSVETADAAWWSFFKRKKKNNPPPPPTNPKPPTPNPPPPSAVPEINAGSAAMGCAVLFGIALIVADHRRRRVVTES